MENILNPNQLQENDKIKVRTKSVYASGKLLRLLDNKALIEIDGLKMWLPLKCIWKDC